MEIPEKKETILLVIEGILQIQTDSVMMVLEIPDSETQVITNHNFNNYNYL
jgi:hypothetical protein